MCGKKLSERHNLRNTPLYKVWRGIKTRCYNENADRYKDYGLRGIIVCDEWLNDFKKFNDWCFENGYKKGLQIDRINNDGNYSPENCRLATALQNNEIGRKRKNKNNKSGYTGVCWDKRDSKWRSEIRYNGKKIYLGSYENIEDAVASRKMKEVCLFGEQKTNL